MRLEPPPSEIRKYILLLPVPDGKPVIGPLPDFKNVLIATGHEGGGLSMVRIVYLCSLVADLFNILFYLHIVDVVLPVLS